MYTRSPNATTSNKQTKNHMTVNKPTKKIKSWKKSIEKKAEEGKVNKYTEEIKTNSQVVDLNLTLPIITLM